MSFHLQVCTDSRDGLANGLGVGYDQALIYATLGELDRGCEALARGLTDHSILMAWMRLDPRMDPLRGRQCFADVEKKLYAPK